MKAWLGNVALVAAVALIAIAVYQRTDARTERVASETHQWACLFKQGLRVDYLATRKFVIDIRYGRRELPAGFTMADVRDAQGRRLARLAEMQSLDCA